MRRAAILALLPFLLGAAQDVEPSWQRYEGGVFVIDLPADWRLLGPAEALQLGDQLPLDMREVTPGRIFALGAVDRWLRDGFDGRGLLVVVRQFEQPCDEALLAETEAFWQDWRGPDGSRREVLASRLVELGAAKHAAMELQMRLLPGESGAQPVRSLDYYASTMGQQLILSLRAWDNRWLESEPEFRRMAESLAFARPPQEPSRLWDKLYWPLIGGAVTGLALVIATVLRRRTAVT